MTNDTRLLVGTISVIRAGAATAAVTLLNLIDRAPLTPREDDLLDSAVRYCEGGDDVVMQCDREDGKTWQDCAVECIEEIIGLEPVEGDTVQLLDDVQVTGTVLVVDRVSTVPASAQVRWSDDTVGTYPLPELKPLR